MQRLAARTLCYPTTARGSDVAVTQPLSAVTRMSLALLTPRPRSRVLVEDGSDRHSSAAPCQVCWKSNSSGNKNPFQPTWTHWAVLVSPSLALIQKPALRLRSYWLCLFTPQISLVLIAPGHGGMARLSLPGWLVS